MNPEAITFINKVILDMAFNIAIVMGILIVIELFPDEGTPFYKWLTFIYNVCYRTVIVLGLLAWSIHSVTS